MVPLNFSLAGQVRQALREHAKKKPCGDPDIEELETNEQYQRRQVQSRIYGTPEYFAAHQSTTT